MFSLRSVRRLSVSVARCAAPAARAPLLSVAARAVSATTPLAAQPSVRRYSATPAALQEATVVNDDGLVIEVNQDNFAATVMKSSTPVILDCYADWCNPCKQLGPMLEAAVRKAGGKVIMAKLNTDENPELAQGLRVQSLPTVMTIHKGSLVEHFVGAQPAPVVEEYVGRAIALAGEGSDDEPTAEAVYITATEALNTAEVPESTEEDAASALAAAKADFTRALELGNLTADASDGEKMTAAASYAGLIRIALAEGDMATAKQLGEVVQAAYPTFGNVPEVKRAMSMLELAQGADEGDDVASLRAQLESDPDNLQVRLTLAQTLSASGSNRAAAQECLEIVKRDASWNEAAGQQLLLKIFEVLGPTHEITVAARKQLAGLLFR